VSVVAKPTIARVTQEDCTALATLFGGGSNPCVRAQAVVVGLGKGRRGPGEHRGGYDSSNSWQEPEGLDIAVLALLLVLLGSEAIVQS
jgi:hypothetical protein